MICHGEVSRSKPASRQLAGFFLMIATGGALGRIFVVSIAPAIFSGLWEFQIALLSCGLLFFLAFILEDRSGRSEQTSWIASVVILPALLVPHVMSLLPKIKSLSFFTNEYYVSAIAVAVLLIVRLLRRNRSEEHTSELQSPDHLVCR